MKERLYQIIVGIHGNIEGNQLSDNLNLIDDLGFDSIKMMTLIVKLEEALSVTFNDEDLDLETISNIGSLAEILEERYHE